MTPLNDINQAPKDPKTSSSDGTTTEDKTSGESTVQEGQQVVNEESQNQVLNEEQTNEEYVSDVNNNTVKANKNPTGLTNALTAVDNEEEDNDNDDDPLTEIEIGDDSEETRKKIPVM